VETNSKACNQGIVYIYPYIYILIYYVRGVLRDYIYGGDDTLENHRVPPPAGSSNNYYTGAHIIIIMIIILFFSFLRQLFPFLISTRPEKKIKNKRSDGPGAERLRSEFLNSPLALSGTDSSVMRREGGVLESAAVARFEAKISLYIHCTRARLSSKTHCSRHRRSIVYSIVVVVVNNDDCAAAAATIELIVKGGGGGGRIKKKDCLSNVTGIKQ